MGEADASRRRRVLSRPHGAHGLDQQRRCLSGLWTIHRNRARAGRDRVVARRLAAANGAVSLSRCGETCRRHCQHLREDSGGAGCAERARSCRHGAASAEGLRPRETMPIWRRSTDFATIRSGDGRTAMSRMWRAAIVLAALHPAAAGRIYNVGEEYTPTIAERLAQAAGVGDAGQHGSEIQFRSGHCVRHDANSRGTGIREVGRRRGDGEDGEREVKLRRDK